jgi:hypothetical protein
MELLNNYQFETRARIAKYARRQAMWQCVGEAAAAIGIMVLGIMVFVIL